MSSTTVSDAMRGRSDSGAELIAGLLRPGAYRHETGDIHVVETHCAWVLLTGPFAYKIKKPVNFGFLDYSTLEKRRLNCEEEVRLNRRFAPQLYLEVVAITGTPTRPQIGGNAPVIEYAVKMHQFPEQCLLSELAETGLLSSELIDKMVDEIAGFHRTATIAPPGSRFGEVDEILRWIMENFSHIRAAVDSPDEIRKLDSIQRWVESERRRLAEVLVERKQQGFIRECHGDLHLGNMTLIDGSVTLFDCIEFNAELRWIDVISETAFVIMDLDALGFPAYANRFLNDYLQQTGDYAGLQPLRWYLVYRALVRAKVAVLRVQQQAGGSELTAQTRADYLKHLQLAENYTRPGTPSMLLMHGLSGSGKTTAARWLCENFGLIQLRSDIERKRLAGLAPLERSGASVGNGLYTQTQTDLTYARLLSLADAVLAAGYAVIVDATFLKEKYREMFRQLAERRSVPWLILSCEASDTALAARIVTRDGSGADASEATLDVLAEQRRGCEALTTLESEHSIRLDTESHAYQDRLPDRLRLHLKIVK